MKTNDAQPFFSFRNIPLWVGLFLCLTLGAVGLAEHRSSGTAVIDGR